MNATSPPERVDLAVTFGGRPLSHALFELELPMVRKDTFNVLLGPAGDDGRLCITRAELLSKVEFVGDMFPMDYVGLELGWTGEIIVRVVDFSAASRLRQAYLLWGETGGFAVDFLLKLEELEEQLASGEMDEAVKVAMRVEPHGARVRVDTVSASGDHPMEWTGLAAV